MINVMLFASVFRFRDLNSSLSSSLVPPLDMSHHWLLSSYQEGRAKCSRRKCYWREGGEGGKPISTNVALQDSTTTSSVCAFLCRSRSYIRGYVTIFG